MESNLDLQKLSGWWVPHSKDGAFHDCSLVIPTYQRPIDIVRLLKKIVELPDQPGEVVIVDGSSDNETEKNISQFSKGIDLRFNLIYVRSQKGLTRQRNVGIDVSSYPFIFFLDDDCLPEPNYFCHTREVFLKDISQTVGAVSGLVLNEIDKPMPGRWRLRLRLGLVPKLQPKFYYPSGTSIPKSEVKPFSGVKHIEILDGCSMTFRRSALEKNRFSEFFFGYSLGEDVEISLRLREDKWKILWCGDAHALHHHAPGGRPQPFTKGKMEVRNRYFIMSRYSTCNKLKGKIRFWLDMGFLIFMDLVWFIRRPTTLKNILHALGLIWGILGVCLSPPSYQDPPPRKQYTLNFENQPVGIPN